MQDTADSPPSQPNLWQVLQANPVTAALILASIAVAFWTHLGSDMRAVRWLTFVDIGPDAADGPLPGLAQGEVWRLVSPILLHFGITHLVFNLLWVYDLGRLIETRWSSCFLLILVLSSGVCANAVQFAINWDFTNGVRFGNALSGGLSGVVYALFAYVWIRGLRDPRSGIRVPTQTAVLMIGWLVACMTGLLGHIGNAAHLTGLIVGAIFGALAKPASAADETGVDP